MVRYKGRFLLIVVLGMLSLLLFAPQSFANAPSTSSAMLPDESWKQLQELPQEVQVLITERLFPEVLKQVAPESQRAAREAIVRIAHEQQSDGLLMRVDGGYYLYGVDLRWGDTLAFTANTEQMEWLYVWADLKLGGYTCTHITNDCSNCYFTMATSVLPDRPGEWHAYGTHHGEFPIWKERSMDIGNF